MHEPNFGFSLLKYLKTNNVGSENLMFVLPL